MKRKLKWSDFSETSLKEHLGSSRLDKILNLKYQTIMYNWSTFLKICTGSDKIIQRKVDIILCGHTHTLKEYRLKEAKEIEAENIRLGFYFTPVYIEVPCKIYTNNYADIINSFQKLTELKPYFDSKKPFIFQSQAVGPLSCKLKVIPPGFRYYYIKENQITKIKVCSLHLK